MDEKIKTWTLRFPAKENPNMERALLDWPLVLQYDVKAKYRMISRKFSVMKFFHPSVRFTNQKPRATRVCTLSINQSNRSISVRLLFLFRSRVFISRSYENRSISPRKTRLPFQMFRCSWKFSAGKTQRVMFHVLSSRIFRKLLVNSKQPLWFIYFSVVQMAANIQSDCDSDWYCLDWLSLRLFSFFHRLTQIFSSCNFRSAPTRCQKGLNTWREWGGGGGGRATLFGGHPIIISVVSQH